MACLCAQKLKFSLFPIKLPLKYPPFPFSQTQSIAKTTHFIKHITYCPPKSEHAFSKTPTNPYAEKLPFRTGSKYSELYGTRLQIFVKILDSHMTCGLISNPHARNFEPHSGYPEGHNPLVYFLVTFSYKRKSNAKTSLLLTFRIREK